MKTVLWLSLIVLLVGTVVFTGCAQAPASPAPSPAPVQSSPAAKPAPAAEPVADFFKKNTITMIAPFAAGGGSDFAARLFASYWSDVSGGGAMIIKNMDGGGGLVGANFAAASKPDGLTLCFGNTSSSHVIPYIFKDAAIKFNPGEQIYLGSLFNDPNMATVGVGTPYETVKDIQAAKGKSLKFGSAGPSSVSAIAIALWSEALGISDLKIITGYKGGADIRLGLTKKEIDGMSTPIHDTYQAVKAGSAKKPFLAVANERAEIYPDTPTIFDVVGNSLSPEELKLYRSGVLLAYSFRALIAPPSMSPDRVKFLRDAFDKIANTPAFKTQALSFFPMFSKPMNGDETTKLVMDSLAIDGAKIKSMISKHLAVQ